MRRCTPVVLAALLVAGAALVPAAPAAAAATWSIVPSGNRSVPATAVLRAVACPTASLCFGAGNYSTGDWNHSLIERWDGTQWSTVASADPADLGSHSGGTYLFDIACASATTCFAVGVAQANQSSTALMLRWDGSTWSLTAGAPVPDADPAAITCPSETSCYAVGTQNNGSTFVEHWDGNAWSAQPSPDVSAADVNGLADVACTSDTACFAVGEAYNAITPRTLIEQWNGTTWSIVPSPTPTGKNVIPYLNAVACATATSCYAAGHDDSSAATKAILQHWDGTTWSALAVPSASGASGASIVGLACPDATDCLAIGATYASSSGYHDWYLRGSGTTWSTVAGPSKPPPQDELVGIGCSSATNCFAVGDNSSARSITVEQWNGASWSPDTHPQPMTPDSTLDDVSCAGTTVCFAVGQAATTASGQGVTFAERQTPTGWQVVPTPNPPGTTNAVLSGVSCPTTTFCFAAGSVQTKSGKGAGTLIERWNGQAWSVVPSPNNPQYLSALTDVTCVTTKSCFAVGSYQGPNIATLIEHWDGTTWKIVPSPSRMPSPNFEIEGVNDLRSISCESATSCFAVGSDRGSKDDFRETLVERWNGKTWTIVKSPNPAKYDSLLGVACATATSCYAVGTASASASSSARASTLIAHWNGSAWARVASADPGSGKRNTLGGVACPSATSCLAVGDTLGGGTDRTLVKQLAGGTWSITPSPNPGGANAASLDGVACPTTTTCAAVGAFADFSAPSTLVEQYG